MLGPLDFVYCPSRDAAADLAHWTEGLGATAVFAVARFETRVACVETGDGPAGPLARRGAGGALRRAPRRRPAGAPVPRRRPRGRHGRPGAARGRHGRAVRVPV